MYALRDVTGTVESPYLICASIMSKKLAEGIDALVLDVKTGSGAFMKTEEDAVFLAELMVETGNRMGKRMVALITDMDQPLGCAVGNALEVEECIEMLRGDGPGGSAPTLHRTGRVDALSWRTRGHRRAKAGTSRRDHCSGEAAREIPRDGRLQGGDPGVIDDLSGLPQAQHTMRLRQPEERLRRESIQCEQVGTACVVLGGGREKKEDSVDPAVGIVLHKKVGDRVAAGELLCTLHYNSEARAAQAKHLLEKSYQIADALPPPKRLVHRIIPATTSN